MCHILKTDICAWAQTWRGLSHLDNLFPSSSSCKQKDANRGIPLLFLGICTVMNVLSPHYALERHKLYTSWLFRILVYYCIKCNQYSVLQPIIEKVLKHALSCTGCQIFLCKTYGHYASNIQETAIYIFMAAPFNV